MNNKRNRSYIELNSLHDVEKLIEDVLTECADGGMAENAGKICNLLNTYLKTWELRKTDEIEKRLEKLEGKT